MKIGNGSMWVQSILEDKNHKRRTNTYGINKEARETVKR